MKTIIKYTLLTASRDLLFIGLFAIIIMAYALAVFTGSTALVEQGQMSLAYFAGASRLAIVTGLIVFVCFHVRRAFDNREVESILSKPITRVEFIISYWLGFAVLAVIVTIPIFLIILTLYNANMVGIVYWCSSLIFEISLVVAFAMLTSLIMRSAVSSVMSTFAFYLISRLMGFFMAAMDQPASLIKSGTLGNIMMQALEVISTIIPRLDLYAKSDWLIYGINGQNDIWIFQVQTIIYIGVILSVAVFDFKRKQF